MARKRRNKAIRPGDANIISASVETSDSVAPIKCGWQADVEIQAGNAEEKKLPRLILAAYNGGPMRLNGWRFPVVVDGSGVKCAAAAIPIYATHEESIENLLGQSEAFKVDADGKISAEAPVAGESETCRQVMALARNGFKFQASINATPNKIEFVPEGESRTVNNRPVVGPVVIARAVTMDHIAVVPLGADTSTSVDIAAQQAAQKELEMEFVAWLKAEYGMDAAALSEDQKAKFQAKFAVAQKQSEKDGKDEKDISAGKKKDGDPGESGEFDPNAAITASRKAQAAEMRRISAIDQIQAKYREVENVGEICALAIESGASVDSVELQLLRASRTAKKEDGGTGPTVHSRDVLPKDGLGDYQSLSAHRGGRYGVNPGGRVSDELCRVIEAGSLISAGYSADKLAKSGQYGERCVSAAERVVPRGLGPMGLMRLAARFAGVQLSDNKDDAWQQIHAEFATLSLPAILSNVMNKLMLESYTNVDPDFGVEGGIAWQKFVKRGPVQDFKPHYRVRLVSDMAMQSLGQGGEIQQGKVSEQSYKIQADTKAIMFGLTRKDIINDDLSAFSSIPTHFGIGAGETIAKSIYSTLLANTQAGYQSDGSTAFWTASAVTTAMGKMAKNLYTSTALSLANLATIYQAFMLQTKPNGAPLGVMPRILLCPPGLVLLAKQIYQTTELIPALSSTGTATGQVSKNVLAGLFKPVSSAYLADSTITGYTSACLTNWYLMTGPNDVVYPIEAGFLNGQEMPIVERDEMEFDRLGIGFRGWVDYGVSLAEQRSAILCQA